MCVCVCVYVCVCVCVCVFKPRPPQEQNITQGQFFERSLPDFNSEFSISKTSSHSKV